MGDRILFNPFDVVEDASISLDDLPAELRIIFKMLLKKDISTRIRGLTELQTWLNQCHEDDFIIARPQFVKVYTQCAMDPERQVRELAHGCVGSLVQNNKRLVSPVVGDLFLPWLGGLLDSSSTVAMTARRALVSCFSQEKLAEVYRVAAPIVISKAVEILSTQKSNSGEELEHIYEVVQSLNACCVIQQNCPCPLDSDEQLSKIISSGALLVERTIENPQSTLLRSSYYRLMSLSTVHPYHSSLKSIFPILLDDLRSSLATLAIKLLACLELSDDQVNELCSVLEKSLTYGIPTNSMPELSRIITSATAKQRLTFMQSIWKVIVSFDGLDSSRLQSIWTMYIVNFITKDEDDTRLIETIKLCVKNTSLQQKKVRPEIFKELQLLNPGAFIKYTPQIIQEASLDPIELVNLVLDLPLEIDLSNDIIIPPFLCLTHQEQITFIHEIINSTQLSTIGRKIFVTYVTNMLQTIGSVECITGLVRDISLEEASRAQDLLSLLLSDMKSVPLETRTMLYGVIFSHFDPSVTMNVTVDNDIVLACCEEANKLNILILLKAFEKTNESLSKYLHTICRKHEDFKLFSPTLPYAKDGVTNSDDKDSRLCFLIFIGLLLDLDVSPFVESCRAMMVAKRLPSLTEDIRSDIAVRLVKYYPTLLEAIFELVNDKGPTLLNKLKDHLSHTKALCSYVSILSSNDIGRFWTGPIENVSLLCRLLAIKSSKSLAIESLTLAAFELCIEEENRYKQACDQIRLGRVLLDSMIHRGGFDKDQLLVMAEETGGFFIILAKELNVSAPLESIRNSRRMAILLNPTETFEIPDDPSDDLFQLLMSLPREWSKEGVYRILANMEYNATDFISDFNWTHFMLNSIMNSSIKDEYWIGHKDLLIQLIDGALNVSMKHDELLHFNSWISDALALAIALYSRNDVILKEIVSDRAGVIWEIFVNIAKWDNHPRIISPIIANGSKLIKSLGRTVLQSVTKPEDICWLLFRSEQEVAKVSCRSLLISYLDEYLERARIKLSEMKRETMTEEKVFEEERDKLLIPWPQLEFALKADGPLETDRFSYNNLFALDLFMCLAEGARDEAGLSSSYAAHFKDELLSKYLDRLATILGWDMPNPKVDLSRMEFTILNLEDQIGESLFAANLLFRCLKTFPSAVRSWYEGLLKGRSQLFIKNCAKFMSPLLIERELCRVRKASSDQLLMRVEQTSTSCTIGVQYSLEEFTFSLNLSIPPEYPLKSASVTGGERLGITESKWRAWLLTVQSLLCQNLAIVEVLQQWRTNAEKTLSGVEPCSVCYCVLQPGDKSLPGPSCKTCKHRFHSACLYRWFKTSGQATCPMCRALF